MGGLDGAWSSRNTSIHAGSSRRGVRDEIHSPQGEDGGATHVLESVANLRALIERRT